MNSNSEPEKTRVFFVRHGVTKGTGKVLYGLTKGLDLTDEGREQAQLLADHVSGIHIDAIYSSPLERAYQTAEALNKGRGLDITTHEGLLDSDIGEWTNFTLDECRELEDWKIVQAHPSQFTFPGGESFVDVLHRMKSAVNEIVASHTGKTVLITGHRDPTILLLGNYLGIHMDLFQRIPCNPASVSEVVFYDGTAKVESINVLPTKRMV